MTGQLTCQDCGSVIEEYDFEEPVARASEDPENTLEHRNSKQKIIIINRIIKNEYAYPLIGRVAVYYKGRRIIVRYSKALAIKIIRENLTLGDCITSIIGRRLAETTIAALIVYAKERVEGSSKTRAVRRASSILGVSEETIDRVLRRYRDRIEQCVERVAESERE